LAVVMLNQDLFCLIAGSNQRGALAGTGRIFSANLMMAAV